MSEFLIEIRGTHDETDQRPFDALTTLLLAQLGPRGFKVEHAYLDFDVQGEAVENEDDSGDELVAAPSAPVFGLKLFDPRGLTATQVKDLVQDINEESVLFAGAALERLHGKNKGGRVGVLGHIESRIQAIIG